MLTIRLQRTGRKNVPFYRVVLTEKQNSSKSGRFLEVLGHYDPVRKDKTVDEDKVKYWLSKGAKPSGTLYNYFVDKGLVSGTKINVLPKKHPIKKEEETAQETPAPEAQAQEDKAPEGGEGEIGTKDTPKEEASALAEEKSTEAQPEETKPDNSDSGEAQAGGEEPKQ